jgi:cell division protein FtsX
MRVITFPKPSARMVESKRPVGEPMLIHQLPGKMGCFVQVHKLISDASDSAIIYAAISLTPSEKSTRTCEIILRGVTILCGRSPFAPVSGRVNLSETGANGRIPQFLATPILTGIQIISSAFSLNALSYQPMPTAISHLKVERQIVLPWSKAIEIAYKSIRLRLSRSLLVTSGIILALAFLMSILVTDRMTAGMRTWAIDFPHSAQAAQLAARREAIERDQFKPLDLELHKSAAQPAEVTEGAEKFDASKVLGDSLADLQKDLGVPLPASENDLTVLLTRHPDQVAKMHQWVAAAKQLKAVREQLVAPQRLQETMKNAGVPSTPREIESSRIQTRWLVGLALLVAFAGILNAMLMSVTERFREIGTMKCLGALDSFIIKLFLIESLFQGVAGTVIGVVLGLILSMANISTSYGSYAWKNVPWASVIFDLFICLGVGIVLTVAGALYPAWQAAKMQPIDAMRVEA